MSEATRVIRRIGFVCGMLALTLSALVLLGSLLRPVGAESYVSAARAVRPWATWGMGSALAGFALCFCGEGRWRFFSVIAAIILFSWWYGAGMAVAR